MTRSSTAALGVLALAAVATASSHDSFRRHHVRQAHAAMEAKRQVITGTAYYGYQNNTMTACGTMSKDTDMIIGVGPNYYGDLNIASSKCGQHVRDINSAVFSIPDVLDRSPSPSPPTLPNRST
jgi:hypothetical protein